MGLSPVVLLTWFAARADGLASAGQFTVQLAVAGASFGVAQWGLRHLLLVDGTAHNSERTFIAARLLMASCAACFVFTFWWARGLLSYYAVAAGLLKFSDNLTDLRLGILQIESQTRAAFGRILIENTLKAGVVFVCCALGVGSPGTELEFAL